MSETAADQALCSPDALPADALPADTVPPDADTSTEVPPAPDAAVLAEPPEPPQFDPRLEIPPSLGPVRRAILDALLDADEPLTVAQLIAQMPPKTSRNVAESSIHRELVAGRIERISAGTYRPAPPPKPKPPEPSPSTADAAVAMLTGFAWPTDPAALAVLSEEEWFAALDAWHANPSAWDVVRLGPPPNQPNDEVPFDIMRRFQDRVRKREERRREADERAARQVAADRELRDELILATGGNVLRSPRLDDVAPIRRVLADGIPMDVVLSAIRGKCDRKIFPGNQPAVSWQEEGILHAIAEWFCRRLAKNMVATWSAAGSASGKPVETPDSSTTNQPARAPEKASAVPVRLAARHPAEDLTHLPAPPC
jgi:hypothetical protein